MSKTWAIIGGGNGGQAMAGHIASMGEKVRLFDVVPATVDALNAKGGIHIHHAVEAYGKLEFATDHREYFETVKECVLADARFEAVEPMPRPPEVWTEFETMSREQGLPIYSAAWRSLPADDTPLAPLTIPSEMEPREGVSRRTSALIMI